MEFFLGLIALAFFVAMIGSPIFALISFRRTGRLEREFKSRLDSLEAEVALLRGGRPDSWIPPDPVSESKEGEARKETLESVAAREKTPWREAEAKLPQAETASIPIEESPSPESVTSEEPVGTPWTPPPAPTQPVPSEEKDPPPPPPRVDWEQWLGVKGAAVLGGVVMILAGLLFFQYSIEHDLISPALRVVIGLAVGVGLSLAADHLRRRDYKVTADALGGAGIVVLYAAIWAADIRYQLIPRAVTWLFMALVTAFAGLQATRRKAPIVAVLGLVGGFATPLFLASNEAMLGSFGYLFLLNLGILTVAKIRRWAWLAILAVVGTALVELQWISPSRPFDVLILLISLSVLSLLFVLISRRAEPDKGQARGMWLVTQISAIFVPFAFTLYFADQLGTLELWPLVGMLVFLTATALWVAAESRLRWMAVGAAMADVTILWVWADVHSNLESWSFAGACLILAALFYTVVDYFRRVELRPALYLVLMGFTGILWTLIDQSGVWPWATVWIIFLAGMVWQNRRPGSERSLLPAFAVVGLSFIGLTARVADTLVPDPSRWWLLVTFLVLAAVGIARTRRGPVYRRWASWGALSFGVLVIFASVVKDFPEVVNPELWQAGVLLLVILLGVMAASLERGWVLLVTALAFTLVESIWVFDYSASEAGRGLLGMLSLSMGILFFLAWPFLVRKLSSDGWSWVTAALIGPLQFFSLKALWEDRWGTEVIGALPVLLAVLCLVAMKKALNTVDGPARRSALLWLSAVSLAFLSVAIPLQVDKQWITLGWALEAFALAYLWKRFDEPGLKYLSWALMGVVTLRLIFNPAVLDYGGEKGWPVLNWIAYTYLIPLACFLGVAKILHGLEVERGRAWESLLYAKERSFGAISAVLLAVLLGFAWINLTVIDAFSVSRSLSLSLERMASRDLAISLSWALYAILLLVIGTWKRQGALRKVSLAFFVLTIGKVFLYDLGELTDLYRVLSLLGLAISLIGVSLLYQRFVFRKDREPKTGDTL